MKIAVATIDGISVSQHFGQSNGFVVFETEGSKLGAREYRTNNQTPHAQGLCNHDDGRQDGAHCHGTIFDLLRDCKIVICGGMGAGASQALRVQGIESVILGAECSVEEAATSYLDGTLAASTTGLCNCKH